MFKLAVSNLFLVSINNKAMNFLNYATDMKSISVSYHYLIAIIMILICLAIFMLIQINRSHKRRSKADEIFKEIAVSQDTHNIWMLLKKYSSETLSDTANFTKESYSGIINGFINKDIRALQKINSALSRRTGIQKKIQQRELFTLQRVNKNKVLEKSTWLHLTNSCEEQMIYCLKRITTPCVKHMHPNFISLPEPFAKELTTVGRFLETFILHIKTSIETANYNNYEQLFFTGNHISEEFSRLRYRLTEQIQKDGKNVPDTFHIYLHLLQESEELVYILRLLLRASRKFQSDQRF